MKMCVCSAAAAAVLLSVVSGPAFGAGTSLVYTYGGGFDLKIPADPAATRGWMQDAVVHVPDHLIICDLNVFVSIRHTAAFDLQLVLQGPSGDAVLLSKSDPFEGYYAGQDYLATTFDDEAEASIRDGMPPFVGSFRPLWALAAFDGQDAYGSWRLQVLDEYYASKGWLEYFALTISGTLPDDHIAVPAPPAAGLALLGLALIGPRVRGRR
jgi:subtilisin-like proprotein convertase family protein